MAHKITYSETVAWYQIKTSVLKFQRKIYSAALLREQSRVRFLQYKLFNSRMLRLWIIYQIYHKENPRITVFQNKLAYFWRNPKSALLALKLVLLPEWKATLNQRNFNYCFSISKYIEDILKIQKQEQFPYLLELNLSQHWNDRDWETIFKKLKYPGNIHFYISYLFNHGILKNYNLFIQKRYFTIEYTHRLDIQISTILLDIFLNEFSELLFKYLSQRNIFLKGYQKTVYYIRNLSTITILDSHYSTLTEIETIFISWLKRSGINLLMPKSTIKSIYNSLNICYYDICKNNSKYSLVKPSLLAQKHLLSLISSISKKMRNASLDYFISKISILLKCWRNYFRACNCVKVFAYLDEQIYQQIRVWVLRRHPKWSKTKIIKKYFPPIEQVKYYSRVYSGKWILSHINSNGEVVMLDKLRWTIPTSYNQVSWLEVEFDLDYFYYYGIS